MLCDDENYCFSRHIVDLVGCGDTFGGGFVYAPTNDSISVGKVKKLADGDGSGRAQR